MSHKHAIDLQRERRRLDDLAGELGGRAWMVGVGGVVLAMAMALIPGFRSGSFSGAVEQFLRSYILAFAYVCSIALGALFFVLIHHVTRAGWSVVVRRVAECIAAQLPWLGLLSLPILGAVWYGLAGVYEWSNAEVVRNDVVLQNKSAYLNPAFFTLRIALYFGIWSVIALYLLKKSTDQDLTGEAKLTLQMQRVSAPGILIFGLTVTFFAFDLLMSLSPHFFSTIWGVYYFAGSMIAFFACAIVLLHVIQSRGRVPHAVDAEHYHDLGKFLFAFVVFWAYIAFSQYMLIWYSNLPEETYWYQARQHTAWWAGMGLTLLFGHFVLPFVLLISRFPKRRPSLLLLGALWMLLMHFVDLHYLVGPDTRGYLEEIRTAGAHKMAAGPASLLTDVPMLLGLGGLFVHLVIRELGRHSLLPERDPRMHESLVFENI